MNWIWHPWSKYFVDYSLIKQTISLVGHRLLTIEGINIGYLKNWDCHLVKLSSLNWQIGNRAKNGLKVGVKIYQIELQYWEDNICLLLASGYKLQPKQEGKKQTTAEVRRKETNYSWSKKGRNKLQLKSHSTLCNYTDWFIFQ